MEKENKVYKEAIAEMQKRYGKENLNFSDKFNKRPEGISTGSWKLDYALGVGGLPRGRIIEFFGNESSGKTTLALQVARECQKNNGKVAYIDAENALDLQYAKNLGVDLNSLLIAHPEHGEQAFAIAEALVKTNMIDLIVIDSVAALVPKAELESNIEDQSIGLLPRLMSKGLRRLQAVMRNSQTCVLFINQLREKVGIAYGNNQITPGGKALRFYSSVRLELKRSEIIKSDAQHIGIKSKVTVVKNKVSSPLETVYLDFYFNKGIDRCSEVIDLAIQYDIIQKTGSWYSYNSNRLCQGKNALIDLIKTNDILFKDIESKTFDFIHLS